jgi:hypothetical protein
LIPGDRRPIKKSRSTIENMHGNFSRS